MNEATVRKGFRRLYLADREQGRIRPLKVYQDLFSEHAALIAEEFGELQAEFPPPPAEERPPVASRRLGHYTIESELGRGGQGQVFLATDSRLERKVALKVLGPSFDFNYVERFKREAAAASRLDHPGICPVYEAGEDNGTQFIAMRYVAGESLADLIVRARGSDASDVTSVGPRTRPQVETTLLLVERAARALHIAHEAGLVHRDIKPGNIMVDPEGHPVILDFGLARDETGTLKSLTVEGDLLGTPAYMSPEQLMAQRITLDRRTDVYSLGVTLFECLTLRRPFEAPTREALYKEILTSHIPDPTRINRALSRELRIVLETACEKDRDRRYQTALEFAEDLKRVRTFEPIRARPLGPLLRFKRWTQRHPAAATALVAAFALLAIGLGIAVTLLQQVRAREAETRAALGRARALALAAESEDVVATDPLLSLLLAREALAETENPRTRSALYGALAAMSQVGEVRLPQRGSVLARLVGERLLIAGPTDKTVRLCDLSGRELERYEVGHGVRSLSVSPDGERFVTCGPDSDQVDLWRVGKPEPVHLASRGPVETVFFLRDGERIMGYRFQDEMRLWNRDGELLLDAPCYFHAYSMDLSRIATFDNAEKTTLWDGDGRKLAQLEGGYCAIAPTGDRLLTFNRGTAKFRLFDGEGKELAVLEPAGDFRFAPYWARDGATFALTTRAEKADHLWIYDRDGKLTSDLPNATYAATLPGRWLAVRPEQKTTVLDDRGKEIATVDGTRQYVWPQEPYERFSIPPKEPEGCFFTVMADGRTLHMHDLDGKPLATFEATEQLERLYATPDRIVATSAGEASLWDTGGKLLARLGGGQPVLVDDRKLLVMTGSDNMLRLYDWDGVAIGPLRGHDSQVSYVGFSPDGRRLVTRSPDGTARIWAVSSRPIPVLRGDGHPVREASFLEGGRKIMTRSDWGEEALTTSDRPGRARIYEDRGQPVCALDHTDLPERVAASARNPRLPSLATISPAGDRILTTAGTSLTARLWDLEGREVSDLGQTMVYASKFLADGRIVTYTNLDGKGTIFGASVWDRDGRHEVKLGEWQRDPGPQFRPRESPAGDRFVTMSDQPGKAQLLARDGRVLARLDHPGAMMRISAWDAFPRCHFFAGGERFVMVSNEGQVSCFLTIFDRDGGRIGEPRKYDGEIRIHMVPETDRVVVEHVESHSLEIVDSGGKTIASVAADGPIDMIALPPKAERIFAFSAAAGTARVWDRDGNEIGVVTSVQAAPREIVYTPAGERLLVLSDTNMVPVLDMDGNTIAVLRGHVRAVADLDVFPDGRRMVTGSRDGTARVWDHDGNLLYVLRGHEGSVETVAVSPDGRTILTTSADGTSRLWPADFAEARRRADEAAFRGFTDPERARYSDLLLSH